LGYTAHVVSLRFGGVRFVAYSNDHPPRHVHGFCGGIEAIIDLRADGAVTLADREDAVRPANAKRPEVRRILRAAAEYFDELTALWEKARGGKEDDAK
jgi:DNA-directed RNA polymerase subunit L